MDVQALRGLAGRAHELSGQARGVADDVVRAGGVVWQSTGAQRYRDDLAAEAREVQAAADELERAAAALRGHADEVEHRLGQIAALTDWFTGAVDEARQALAGAADGVADAATDGAQRLVDAARSMPSPGSLDWGGCVGRCR